MMHFTLATRRRLACHQSDMNNAKEGTKLTSVVEISMADVDDSTSLEVELV